MACGDEDTMRVVASRAGCPPEALTAVAETAIAAGEAYNSSGTYDYSDDCDPTIFEHRHGRAAAAAVVALRLVDGPPDRFERAAKAADHNLRIAAVSNPACPPQVLAEAATRSRRPLARPPEDEMTQSTWTETGEAALRNPGCPAEVLAAAAVADTSPDGNDIRWERNAAAANPSCPPQRLVELCADDSRKARLGAIANPSLPKAERDRIVTLLLA